MAEACEDHAASPSGEILMIMRVEVFQNNYSENLFFFAITDKTLSYALNMLRYSYRFLRQEITRNESEIPAVN